MNKTKAFKSADANRPSNCSLKTMKWMEVMQGQPGILKKKKKKKRNYLTEIDIRPRDKPWSEN